MPRPHGKDIDFTPDQEDPIQISAGKQRPRKIPKLIIPDLNSYGNLQMEINQFQQQREKDKSNGIQVCNLVT